MSESVPEDPALKGRVLAQFNALCPARTIFTTNTSTLLPSMFAAATGRPDRVVALHFHPPVWSSNVADVMPHPGTSPETTDLVLAFARRIGQIPIHLRKESYGYVFNAMYSAMNEAALALAANGVASVEDVDRAWMGIMQDAHRALRDARRGRPRHGLGHRRLLGRADRRRAAPHQRRLPQDLRRSGPPGRQERRGLLPLSDPAYAQPGFVESGAGS